MKGMNSILRFQPFCVILEVFLMSFLVVFHARYLHVKTLPISTAHVRRSHRCPPLPIPRPFAFVTRRTPICIKFNLKAIGIKFLILQKVNIYTQIQLGLRVTQMLPTAASLGLRNMN